MPTNFNKQINEIWLLENHLRAKHPHHVNSNLNYFKALKKKFRSQTKITSLFATQTATLNRILEASYEISLLIAKNEKNHCFENNLDLPRQTRGRREC